MAALTYVEARERAELLDVHGYTVDIDLTRGEEVFGCETVIRFACRRPGAATFVEFSAARLTNVTLNGRPLEVAAFHDNRLSLPDLLAENELRVVAEVPYSHTGDGMHRFVDPADGQTYIGAYCGVDNAHQVFACFDQPDLKAVLEVTATAPEEWTVVGNGIGRRAESGSGRWRFAPTPRLSCYLFVLVAGALHTVPAEHSGIPFNLYCRRSLAEDLDRQADELLEITRNCFDRYRELFDEPYAFDSYDQVFVPELNWGALESPGCVLFRDDFVFRSAVTEAEHLRRGMVIAHEMAHMWFGDLVTMRWWEDLWLSESFAEYMGYQVLSEATRFAGTWTDFAVVRKTFAYDADQRPSTHPVAPETAAITDLDEVLPNFDTISYVKGASALRQLVAWLGQSVFLAGINDFLAKYRFDNASLTDLLDCLARASGRDVHAWARSWLRTTGVDTLTPVFEVDVDGPGDGVIVHNGSRPHYVAVGLYDEDGGEPRCLVPRTRVALSLAADAGRVTLPANLDRPDLVLLNDGDLSYCKVRFDPVSWQTVTRSLSAMADPLSRAVIWTSARHLVRDGELAPVEYLELAARHLPAETNTAIVATVLSFAREHIADRYVDPDRRLSTLRTIAEVCRELLTSTDIADASGLRLAALRGFVDSCATPTDTADLAGWLAADTLPGGPALDSDLRWRMLLRLVVLGGASRADIDAEADRDRTWSGQCSAASCRAALGEPAAKEVAWRAMFDSDAGGGLSELSNDLLAATAQGFWQPEQHELLAEYLPRYCDAAVDTAARRGSTIATIVGRHGFPTYAVAEETIRAVQQCLHLGNPVPALRRQLADQLDDLHRAMRIRQL